jgi:dihydroorotase
MPNTDPPLDSPALVSYVLEKSGRSPGSRLLPAGCVSRERKGKVLAEMGKMAKAGAVIFTDDGNPVSDTGLLRLALQYSSWLGVRLMEHPEEKSLTKDAQVNEGICSSFSGLKGWPSSAEASDISRASLSAGYRGPHSLHPRQRGGFSPCPQGGESIEVARYIRRYPPPPLSF